MSTEITVFFNSKVTKEFDSLTFSTDRKEFTSVDFENVRRNVSVTYDRESDAVDRTNDFIADSVTIVLDAGLRKDIAEEIEHLTNLNMLPYSVNLLTDNVLDGGKVSVEVFAVSRLFIKRDHSNLIITI